MNYEKNKNLKILLEKSIALMKLKELLKKNLITKEEYEKIKKKFNFLEFVEKNILLCYNVFEVMITSTKRRINVSS